MLQLKYPSFITLMALELFELGDALRDLDLAAVLTVDPFHLPGCPRLVTENEVSIALGVVDRMRAPELVWWDTFVRFLRGAANHGGFFID